MPIDRTDRAIIAELAGDSRLSMEHYCRAGGDPRTPAHHRVQKLIADGVLIGLRRPGRPQVDRAERGGDRHHQGRRTCRGPKLATALSKLPFVESVLAVSGDIDFVVTVSAPDQEHLSEVIMRQIQGMPGVVSTRSHVVLDATAPPPPRNPAGRLARFGPVNMTNGTDSPARVPSVTSLPTALSEPGFPGSTIASMSDAMSGRSDVQATSPIRPTELPDQTDRREGRARARKTRCRLRGPGPEILLSLYRRMVVARRFEGAGRRR